MADTDREYRDRRPDEPVDSINASGAAGWWIAGLLALAVLIIGFIALSGGNPAPVEDTVSIGVETAPTTEQAPTAPAPEEAAPAEGAAAPAAEEADPAAGATAPAPEETAPATEETAPAQ